MNNREEKRALVRQLHNAGVLLAPCLLDVLTPASAQELLQKAGAAIVLEPTSPLITTPTTPPQLRPVDVSAFYRRRFDALQPLLAAKTESVSIAHLTPFSTATVVGMVTQLTPTGFIVDDPTGTLHIATKDTVTPGEVVAVSGDYREGTLAAHKVVYPDVPLSRQLPSLHTPLLLSPQPAEVPDTLVICPPAYPARITLPTFIILAHRPAIPLSSEQAQQHLLHRCFPAPLPAGDDLLLLEPLPDLIWLLQDQNWQKSYKGVLIVSTAPGSAARIGTDLSVSFVPTPVGSNYSPAERHPTVMSPSLPEADQ